jgi:hypothetical protein
MIGPSSILEVDITNHSDARFLLEDLTDYEFYSDGRIIEVLPQSTKRIEILTDKVKSEDVVLNFKVLNAIIGRNKNAQITFNLKKE